MNLFPALALLDEILPDEFVRATLLDLFKTCEPHDGCVHVELEALERGYVAVPLDAHVEVITKAFSKMYFDLTFGDFVVQVAIGGAKSDGGVLKASYCFATLFFNEIRRCVTVDFHLEVR